MRITTVLIVFCLLVGCGLKPPAQPAMSGGNQMKMRFTVLELSQDSMSKVVVEKVTSRNSSSLTQEAQTGDTLDIYFENGFDKYTFSDVDGNKYAYPEIEKGKSFDAVLMAGMKLNSQKPSYKAIWYKKSAE